MTSTTPNKSRHSTAAAATEPSAAQLIDARIARLDDWRGTTLAQLRRIIRQAHPGIVETVKWRGVPVWEHAGIVCTGETYKAAVKMTFAKGAALDDPAGLFNASLDGATRRAIDVHEGDAIDAAALTALIRAAVALNVADCAARAGRSPAARGAPVLKKTTATKAAVKKSAVKKSVAKKGAAHPPAR